MVFRKLVALVLIAGALHGLVGCGDSGDTGPGDKTPPAVSNLEEGQLQQTLPARKPMP